MGAPVDSLRLFKIVALIVAAWLGGAIVAGSVFFQASGAKFGNCHCCSCCTAYGLYWPTNKPHPMPPYRPSPHVRGETLEER